MKLVNLDKMYAGKVGPIISVNVDMIVYIEDYDFEPNEATDPKIKAATHIRLVEGDVYVVGSREQVIQRICSTSDQ